MSSGKDSLFYNGEDTDTDDSVSVTSSVVSEQADTYEIKTILSEKEVDGQTLVLIEWEGYPTYRATWEPISNFVEVGKDFEDPILRKKIIDSHNFDVDAWEEDQRRRVAERGRRLNKRRARRMQLGLYIDQDYSGDEREASESSASSRKQRSINQNLRNQSEPSDDEDLTLEMSFLRASQLRRSRHVIDSDDSAGSDNEDSMMVSPDMTRKELEPTGPELAHEGAEAVDPVDALFQDQLPRVELPNASASVSIPSVMAIEFTPSSGPPGNVSDATTTTQHTKPSLNRAKKTNVLANWTKPKIVRRKSTVERNPTKPALFKTWNQVRRAQVKSRNERTPDPSDLQWFTPKASDVESRIPDSLLRPLKDSHKDSATGSRHQETMVASNKTSTGDTSKSAKNPRTREVGAVDKPTNNPYFEQVDAVDKPTKGRHDKQAEIGESSAKAVKGKFDHKIRTNPVSSGPKSPRTAPHSHRDVAPPTSTTGTKDTQMPLKAPRGPRAHVQQPGPKEPITWPPTSYPPYDPIPEGKIAMVCSYWDTGYCDPNRNCLFIHEVRRDLELSRLPVPPKYDSRPVTCHFWWSHICQKSSDQCLYAHWNTGTTRKNWGGLESIDRSELPKSLRQNSSGSIIQSRNSSVRLTCPFWLYTECKHTSTTCVFKHYDTGEVASWPNTYNSSRAGKKHGPRGEKNDEDDDDSEPGSPMSISNDAGSPPIVALHHSPTPISRRSSLEFNIQPLDGDNDQSKDTQQPTSAVPIPPPILRTSSTTSMVNPSLDPRLQGRKISIPGPDTSEISSPRLGLGADGNQQDKSGNRQSITRNVGPTDASPPDQSVLGSLEIEQSLGSNQGSTAMEINEKPTEEYYVRQFGFRSERFFSFGEGKLVDKKVFLHVADKEFLRLMLDYFASLKAKTYVSSVEGDGERFYEESSHGGVVITGHEVASGFNPYKDGKPISWHWGDVPGLPPLRKLISRSINFFQVKDNWKPEANGRINCLLNNNGELTDFKLPGFGLTSKLESGDNGRYAFVRMLPHGSLFFLTDTMYEHNFKDSLEIFEKFGERWPRSQPNQLRTANTIWSRPNLQQFIEALIDKNTNAVKDKTKGRGRLFLLDAYHEICPPNEHDKQTGLPNDDAQIISSGDIDHPYLSQQMWSSDENAANEWLVNLFAAESLEYAWKWRRFICVHPDPVKIAEWEKRYEHVYFVTPEECIKQYLKRR